MRQMGRWVALVLCGVLLTAGCSATVTGGQAVRVSAGPAAATAGSWSGTAAGIALFVQWERVGANVTGHVEAASTDTGTVLTTERVFIGVVDGNAVLLSFGADTSSAAESITGSLNGAVLTLNWPSDSGAVNPVQLRTGTIDDFNRALSTATAAAAPPSAGIRTFDADKVAAGVGKILTDAPPGGYGATGVSDVHCPSGQPVIAGSTFTCTVIVNGAAKSVVITVKDSSGTYEVGVPG